MENQALAAVANRTRRKIALRILPFVFVLYIVNYLDRTNVSVAMLDMKKELDGFTENVFGTGIGIFFIGYLLLEIPGALLVERWSARRWIARILISWGLCSAAMAAIQTPTQFYWVRFLLGLAEAGFFPGIIVYLTHWFAPRDRARAMAGLILAIPISMGLGSPVSGLLLNVDWLGLSGWRWVFILEGVPAVLLGFVTLFYLTDRPRDARWLKPEEREWIIRELEAEKQRKAAAAHITVFQSFRQRNVILLTLALFFSNLNNYVFQYWLPSVIKDASGRSSTFAAVCTGLPYAAGLLAAVWASYVSDKKGKRKLYTVVPLCLFALLLMGGALPGQPFWLVMVWLTLAGGAAFAYPPSFWVLPTLTLSEAAAAASIGMINSLGNFSGFVSPKITGRLLAQGVTHAQLVPYLCLCTLIAAACVAALRIPAAASAKPDEELAPQIEPG
jgi:ACS family tartrate transporter-like MFS transporter